MLSGRGKARTLATAMKRPTQPGHSVRLGRNAGAISERMGLDRFHPFGYGCSSVRRGAALGQLQVPI